MKKGHIIAALLLCMQLTACGAAGEIDTTVTSAEAQTEEQTAAEITEPTETETQSETSEEVSKETEAGTDEEYKLISLNEAEVVSGYPDVCDTDSINARQKNDVEGFYSSEYAAENPDYSQLAPLEMVSPDYESAECRYISHDFDNDGENEYYLIIENTQTVSDSFCAEGSDEAGGIEFGKALTFYYIEENGETKFAGYMNCVSSDTRYISYKIADYGSCRHMIFSYWPAYDGVGGSGNARLFDKARFFDINYGGVFADGDGVLKSSTYTLVDDCIFDGSDYTVYEYNTEMQDENGDWTELDDYHINPVQEPYKIKWYCGE